MEFQLQDLPTERLQEIALRGKVLAKAAKARDGDMLSFMEVTNPDPQNPNDINYSSFVPTPLARLLSQIIEKVDAGEEKRVCVSVGPQFGKSQVLSRGAPAWLSGRNPRRHMILGSYNDTFAEEFGGEVRTIMNSDRFLDVFPDYRLQRGSESKSLLMTQHGGKMAFVGIGGKATGKPADIFFIDDPYKNDEDAQSEVYREKVWKWFTAVSFARCHKDSAIVIVHTRWHEDDLIGRLCDPDHPERNRKYKGIAERWRYYNLPAVIDDPKLADALGLKLEVPQDQFIKEMFGEKPIVSLWEGRKSLEFLAEAKQVDPRVFGALYMGCPTPDDGTYFTEDMIVEYELEDLPKNLRKYGASDHGASEKNSADPSVIGCVGVDADDDIWVLPDIVWERMETDKTVEALLQQMQTHNPAVWWMESELISKSFGPFLRRRMHEEKVYIMIDPQKPTKDKKLRARSIQGRMSMRKVHFPRFAPWWPDAKRQLLKFPYGTNDDFVDWLAWHGLGLLKEQGAKEDSPKNTNVIRTNSFAWIKASSERRKREEKHRKAMVGW